MLLGVREPLINSCTSGYGARFWDHRSHWLRLTLRVDGATMCSEVFSPQTRPIDDTKILWEAFESHSCDGCYGFCEVTTIAPRPPRSLLENHWDRIQVRLITPPPGIDHLVRGIITLLSNLVGLLDIPVTLAGKVSVDPELSSAGVAGISVVTEVHLFFGVC